MGSFDAMAHSLSTVSTDGFSPQGVSMGYCRSEAVELVAILFTRLVLPSPGFWRRRRGRPKRGHWPVG
jgi:hypothetical protein